VKHAIFPKKQAEVKSGMVAGAAPSAKEAEKRPCLFPGKELSS
jgi:hypothetical protein